jgi:hypothetical protein
VLVWVWVFFYWLFFVFCFSYICVVCFFYLRSVWSVFSPIYTFMGPAAPQAFGRHRRSRKGMLGVQTPAQAQIAIIESRKAGGEAGAGTSASAYSGGPQKQN